jgi:hypothetical protein
LWTVAALAFVRSPFLPAALLVSSLVAPIAFALQRKSETEQSDLVRRVEQGLADLGTPVRVASTDVADKIRVRLDDSISEEEEAPDGKRARLRPLRRVMATGSSGGFRPMPR